MSLDPPVPETEAPRSTRRKKVNGIIRCRSAEASVSDVARVTPLSLAYAGERTALIAERPGRQRVQYGRAYP